MYVSMYRSAVIYISTQHDNSVTKFNLIHFYLMIIATHNDKILEDNCLTLTYETNSIIITEKLVNLKDHVDVIKRINERQDNSKNS